MTKNQALFFLFVIAMTAGLVFTNIGKGVHTAGAAALQSFETPH